MKSHEINKFILGELDYIKNSICFFGSDLEDQGKLESIDKEYTLLTDKVCLSIETIKNIIEMKNYSNYSCVEKSYDFQDGEQ